MGLFSRIRKSVINVVKNTFDVVSDGVTYAFNSVDHMINSVSKAAINMYKGFERATLLFYKNVINPLVGLPSDIVRTINKAFIYNASSRNFREFLNTSELISDMNKIPILPFRDLHELNRRHNIEKFVIPTLINSQQMSTYIEAKKLSNENRNLFNVVRRP